MLKHLIFYFFTFFYFYGFSQEVFSISIPWEEPRLIVKEDKEVIIPMITDQGFNINKPNFYWIQKIPKMVNASVIISSFSTSEARMEEISFLKSESIEVPLILDAQLKFTRSAKDGFVVVNLFPFVMEDGLVKRINSLDVTVTAVSYNFSLSLQKSTVANSVLSFGSGSWHKISVNADGIYKIDKNFLESCGINLNDVDPRTINIFGNGEGKLPELNSILRTDDLAKNAIFVFGEADGVFDENDYILFYAWGPDRWYPNGTNGFVQDKNIYSKESYYFININPSETGLRISSVNSSPLAVTNTVNSYSFYATHESDIKSLFSGGQRWYGELFDSNLDQIFSFNVPNIDASFPAKFKVSMASNAIGGATSQNYFVNGTLIFSAGLPSGNYGRSEAEMQVANPSSSLPLNIKVVRSTPSTLTYLDKITLNARRKLVLSDNQFNFSDLNSYGTSQVGGFTIENFTSNSFVWDVSDRHNPSLVNGQLNGSNFSFQLEIESLKSFVASNGSGFFTPVFVKEISPQNLHGLTQADYLIITHPAFFSQAERLADLHRETGLLVHVVTTEQVYNEFSSGMLDPTAIRSFGKMFYDRSVLNSSLAPKYLLLFGDGTYDARNIVSAENFVPTYQVLESENYISAMVTDDYYGLFNDNESIEPTDLLDIGIGRLLISDNDIAKQQVDKIEHYIKNGSSLFSSGSNSCLNSSKSTFGDWRLKTVLVADDEDSGYFITSDNEPNSVKIKKNHPEINIDKLYSDAFVQVSGAGGERYPDVVDAITDRVERGALIVNYVGHGGETGWAGERILKVPQIQDFRNIDVLNLMVTATCEFTKYDDPERVSGGEWQSLNPNGGSIALMTTTRAVYFSVNTITGSKFYDHVFSRDATNKPLTFGEIIRLTKNQAGATDNKRSFTLIGDPALRIALPEMRIVTDSINSLSPTTEIDTIRALSKITIKGHLEDYSSNVLSSFNGVLSPSVFDKPKTMRTLGQNSSSPIISFDLQKNVLYKGKATVVNGYFEFSFIVPKDINYSFGLGKISYYADNGVYDASGLDTNLIIGGVDPLGISDNEGPQINLYLNDKNFINTGISDETPVLIAELSDENGINTVGNGVGHDILAVLDGNSAKPIILNDYYTANLDTYKSGKLQYDFSKLEKGRHTLSLKVWDVNSNSSQANIEFTVQEKEEISLDHVLNYPNPFTTKTDFYFEHNQVCSNLETQIQIFTISGRLVKTINKDVMTEGFRSQAITWDGLDDFGDKLGKGVYVYKIKVKSPDGKIAEKLEKLVIL